MVTRCGNCGGTVTTRQASGTIACEYCGAAIRLDGDAGRQASPGPALEPVRAAPARPGGRRSPTAVLVVVGLLVVLAGVVAYFVASGGALSTFGEWYSPGACLVDADGDRALDLVGWAGSPSDQRNLSLLDGETGQRTWSRAVGYEQEATLLCTGRGGFAVARPDFTLELFQVASRDRPVSIRLSDQVTRYALGQGCVQVETADGRTVGLDPATGAPVACAPLEAPRSPHAAIGAVSDGPASAAVGDVVYTVAPREQGTPVLTVSASRAGAPLWSVPLRHAAVSDGAVVAAWPEVVATWGVDPADPEVGLLVGLDPATGAVRYERRQGSHWSGRNFRGFQQNGRFVIVAWGFGIHAYEPATGERAWHIGGR